MSEKSRLDLELVRRGLAEDQDQAGRYVLAGEIWVDDQRAVKPDQRVSLSAEIRRQEKQRYVSRGGRKLEGALSRLDISIEGKICADVGASTGGFTDCLLQHDARKVYAIDVGRGQLHWKLRQDDRVVTMEKTDARDVKGLPDPIDLVTVDAAFISLRRLIPTMADWLRDGGELLALVKPQFEAQPAEVESGGVVRSKRVQRRVLENVLIWLLEQGLPARGVVQSELPGPKGNQEYFVWAIKGGDQKPAEQLLADLF